MPTLYLLRHAKSSWEDSALADHERPLSKRGRRSAQLLAGHLRHHRIAPSLILCSSARRTCETLELLAPALDEKRTVTRVLDSLYMADGDDLLDQLRGLRDDVPSVMLIGHNPGMQDLALTLAAGGAALEQLRTKFPTGALATLRVRGLGWHTLAAGGADLVELTTPRDLEQE